VARDPGGSKLGYKDWQTLLSVKLDGGGVLRDVSVVKSSGLDFLDRTAVDAFQKAQPFSNPPQGLADSRGEIVFTFGFYLETGGSGLHLFRGPALPR
jgi:TonB family protein